MATATNGTTSRCDDDEQQRLRCDCYYAADEYVESVRSSTGLEVGVRIKWPGLASEIELSTRLEEQQIEPMFHGTAWAGTRVWRASVVMLQYLLSISSESEGDDIFDARTIDSTTSVLELGCGLGVPGIVLNQLRGCRVVLTDLEPLVDQLRSNLQRNGLLKSNNNTAANNNAIIAEPLDWSNRGVQELLRRTQPFLLQQGGHAADEDDEDDGAEKIIETRTAAGAGAGAGKFDVVINCDCIFEPLYGESWKQLLECQEALLRANPRAYVLTGVERRKYDGVDRYLRALEESSAVRKVERIALPSSSYPSEVQIYRLYGATGESTDHDERTTGGVRES